MGFLLMKLDNHRESEQISRERQLETDEIFTNKYCCDLMISMLKEEDFYPGKTFLEPSAGDGNLVEAVLRQKLKYCTPTEAIKDIFAIEYMKDNYDFLCNRVLNIIGDTPEHRKIVMNNFAFANTIDQTDTSEGRKYPEWMPDYVKPMNEPGSLDFFFE